MMMMMTMMMSLFHHHITYHTYDTSSLSLTKSSSHYHIILIFICFKVMKQQLHTSYVGEPQYDYDYATHLLGIIENKFQNKPCCCCCCDTTLRFFKPPLLTSVTLAGYLAYSLNGDANLFSISLQQYDTTYTISTKIQTN